MASDPYASMSYREDREEKPDIESPEEGLLPVTMFPDGVKPGYKCTIEVVGVSGDEVRVIKKHKDDDEDEDKKEDSDEDPFTEENLNDVRERVGDNY